MSLPIGRFTPYQALAASPLAGVGASAAAADPRAAAATVADAIVGSVPPAPTQEAREMVDSAAQVVDHLTSQTASCTSRRTRQRTAW